MVSAADGSGSGAGAGVEAARFLPVAFEACFACAVSLSTRSVFTPSGFRLSFLHMFLKSTTFISGRAFTSTTAAAGILARKAKMHLRLFERFGRSCGFQQANRWHEAGPRE